MPHHPAHKTRALDRYDPGFREQAEDLFERVKDRVGGERAVRLTGSYSIHAYFHSFATPLTLAKIIIREDFPPDTYVDEAGVHVLIRADDWMAGWLDREPWTRVDLGWTRSFPIGTDALGSGATTSTLGVWCRRMSVT